MSRQLTLSVGLSDRATFENFLASPENAEMVAAIKQFALDGVGLVYMFGDQGSGKTHLMYAAQRAAMSNGLRAAYFSVMDPDVAENIVSFLDLGQLVCVDDLDAIAGSARLERLLFNIIEQQKQSGSGLLLAARWPPSSLKISMPDLLSRLKSGASYCVRTLDDGQKREAMRLRAHQRGFSLSDDVIDYVMRRFPRDTAALFDLLDRIDRASLSDQRRVTVPFVKGLSADIER